MTEPTDSTGPGAAGRSIDPSQPTEPLREHRGIRQVEEALARLGVRREVVILPDAASTAALAAAQLGVEVGQIANSLVFAGFGCDERREPVLVLASGAHRVDTDKVSALLDLQRLERADAEFVRAATGYAIGGVAPVGHPAPIRTAVDVDLARYDRVWVGAGHHRAVFATSYDELLRITGGVAVEVA